MIGKAENPAAACSGPTSGPGPPKSTAPRNSTERLTGNAPGPTRPMETTVKAPASPAQAPA